MRIHKVEQGSDAWKRLRLGKISGTRVKDVFKSDNLGLIDQLIAESISDEIEEDGFVNAAMERGTNYEPLARMEYEKKTGQVVEQFGFLQHNTHDWLGYSPDGLVRNEEGKYTHGIEIKCPNTYTHVKYIRMGGIPNEYKYQIYNAFIVCQDLQTMDFISYDTRFAIKPMHIVRINRVDIAGEISETEIGLLKFRSKWEKYYNEICF